MSHIDYGMEFFLIRVNLIDNFSFFLLFYFLFSPGLPTNIAQPDMTCFVMRNGNLEILAHAITAQQPVISVVNNAKVNVPANEKPPATVLNQSQSVGEVLQSINSDKVKR